jgi:hypothetical protein
MGGFPFPYILRFPVLENINFLNICGSVLWMIPKHPASPPGPNLASGMINDIAAGRGVSGAMTRG